MAVSTGFSSSHVDFLSKFKSFICDTMTPSGNRWTAERYITTSGSEELIISKNQKYVGLKAYADSVADNYCLILNGFTGFNNTLTFYTQPGGMTLAELPPCLPLVNSNPVNTNAIKYWIIADDTCIKVICRIGTVYHQAYLGFYTTYGTPPQYPYPLCVGGSGIVNGSGIPSKQNDTTVSTHAYWKPKDTYTGSSIQLHVGNLAIKDPGGSFRRIYNVTNVFSTGTSACAGTWPYLEDTRAHLGGFANMRSNIDGSYSLQPVILVDNSPANMYGEFTGLKHVTGYNLNSEDLVNYNSEDYLVIQDVFRTGDSDMVAYRLV